MVAQHYEIRGKEKPSIKFHEADFRDANKMAAILRGYSVPLGYNSSSSSSRSRITGVIHFAAYKAVGESLKLPLKYYSNNVGGLIEFVTLLNDFGIKRLVFSSSATVYGTVADLGYPLREEFCSHERTAFVDNDGFERTVESGCSGLTNAYGRTKWMCEAILSGNLYFYIKFYFPVRSRDHGSRPAEPCVLTETMVPQTAPRILTLKNLAIREANKV